ncbi:MAG TPA: error-prone DNA polymerase [Thermoanaerobaculia bacterium]|nr:error-prone DNA polymerase [Thermoanaerobaculia bacterium]
MSADDDDAIFPDSPPPATRRFRAADGSPDPGYLSAGARKEKLRQQRSAVRDVSGAPQAKGARRAKALPYPELRVASAFSFLDAASLPEDLVARAAALELPAVALVDRSGVYGAPRFYKAAKEAGIRALVGAEVMLKTAELAPSRSPRALRALAMTDSSTRSVTVESSLRGAQRRSNLDRSRAPTAATTRRRAEPLPVSGPNAPPRLTLLVESRAGYKTLCRLLTAAARDKPKGAAAATWEEVAAHTEGLCCITGGDEGPLAHALRDGNLDAARDELARLAALFPGRLYVELQRHRRRDEEHRNVALVDLARRLRLPLVATNGVRYARRRDKPLHDVLACIREHTTLDGAGTLLAAERERHLKGAADMAALFRDLPAALANARELAARLDFTLADLGYRFPDFPLPPGETPMSYLRHLAWNGARARFQPLSARAQAQIQKELLLIEKLELAGYFLIVWDVVRFCNEQKILVQGRGSAANSAVCYALGITAVDPVKMELLFERFLSEERGEWPDIDLDLPSGDQREKAIQYVYRQYGADGGSGAAMTANVITYRDRSAARETAKSLGWSSEQIDRLGKQLGSWNIDRAHGDPRELAGEMASAGFDPQDPRVQRFAHLWLRIQNLPRHLGQHSGGMVIAAGRLDEVVPLEPASMPGRTVVQWDKDDCADLGLIKVDLLGLGMLDALEEAVPLVLAKEGVVVDFAQLPPDDPKVFGMLQQADTVGVFQVESRAQMASLPRNHPERFYDLVVQVAIIRPGPIVGGMVNPYFERRRGREEIAYAHPSLIPVLKRTLGVPLFQEQILRMAMVTAGFSGGEAEELRRAMGFKRSVERMEHIERRLREGMAERGIHGATQDSIVTSIKSFALYGFPESHAASFALIAYSSAWLKAYHPTAFLIALLNAYPMGFYHPATLVTDARRHGVEVRPIDVNHSGWKCRWEEREEVAHDGSRSLRRSAPRDDDQSVIASAAKRSRSIDSHVRGACRLGMKFVRGLRAKVAERIETEQARGRFRSADDLALRCALHRDELATLAHAGALASLGLTRRQALWQVALASRAAGELFTDGGEMEAASPLPEMTAFEETRADFDDTEMTTGRHPVTYVRALLDARGVTPAAQVAALPNRKTVRIGGAVIVRQRPGTARGLIFVTLEDETGTIQAAVMPDLIQKHRQVLVRSPGLIIEGVLQKRDGTVTVKAEKVWPLQMTEVTSHDFH